METYLVVPRELSRPAHCPPGPLVLFTCKQEKKFFSQFLHFFIFIVIDTSKLLYADFEIYEDDPPLSEKALDGWTGQGKNFDVANKPGSNSRVERFK